MLIDYSKSTALDLYIEQNICYVWFNGNSWCLFCFGKIQKTSICSCQGYCGVRFTHTTLLVMHLSNRNKLVQLYFVLLGEESTHCISFVCVSSITRSW